MRARTTQILEAAVREFIRTGLPVSSLGLSRRGAFGVGAATIRAELNSLTNDGYLSQLHTSGGRVPADKGYELFVERVLALLPAEETRRGDLDLAREFLESPSPFGAKGEGRREFVRCVSRRLHLLSVGYAPESGDLYQSGLDDLFERLEVEGRPELTEIARDIEALEERVARIIERSFSLASDEHAPWVFIGKKSPLTTSEHLSVIMDKYADGSGGHFFFLTIGPKRMDYQRNLSLFKILHDSLCHDR